MSWKHGLKKAFDALGQAHVGEFLSLEEKCRVLGTESPREPLVPLAGPPPRRLVAVKVEPNLPPALWEYAIDTCRRMEAGLLLLGQTAIIERALEPFTPILLEAGVHYHIETRAGNDLSTISHYVNRHGEVVCLIMGAGSLPDRARQLRHLHLPVPVVMVPDTSTA